MFGFFLRFSIHSFQLFLYKLLLHIDFEPRAETYRNAKFVSYSCLRPNIRQSNMRPRMSPVSQRLWAQFPTARLLSLISATPERLLEIERTMRPSQNRRQLPFVFQVERPYKETDIPPNFVQSQARVSPTLIMSTPEPNQQPHVFFVNTDGVIFRYLHSTAISEQVEAIENREKNRKLKVRILSSPYNTSSQSNRNIDQKATPI